MSFDLFQYDKETQPIEYLAHMKKIRDCTREIILEYVSYGRGCPALTWLCDDVMERLNVEVTTLKDGTNNYLVMQHYIRNEVSKARNHFLENRNEVTTLRESTSKEHSAKPIIIPATRGIKIRRTPITRRK